MTRNEVLHELGKLSPEDREDIRQTLNRRHEIETEGAATSEALAAEKKRLGG